jgi:biotin transporter BioY
MKPRSFWTIFLVMTVITAVGFMVVMGAMVLSFLLALSAGRDEVMTIMVAVFVLGGVFIALPAG